MSSLSYLEEESIFLSLKQCLQPKNVFEIYFKTYRQDFVECMNELALRSLMYGMICYKALRDRAIIFQSIVELKSREISLKHHLRCLKTGVGKRNP